jgi:ABC-2 type transport system ATP-binding protein
MVNKLTKCYGSYTAVNGISFAVPKGKVIGLLGPNGAGKTTTIQMLLGITLHNGGTINYFGLDFVKHRQACLQRINFASSFNTLQGRISVWENLLVFADLYQVVKPKRKIMELVRYFQIEELLPKRFWDLSSGQKTRVNLVKALINDPELILMDEPTASLDPDIADKLLSLIEQLRRERQLSLVYTSHDMAEVARICDEVIFLDHGNIVAHDTPLGLTKRITHSQFTISFDGDKSLVSKTLTGYQLAYEFVNPFTVVVTITEPLIPKVIFKLSETGIWITNMEIKKPTLADVFLQIARGAYDFTKTN